jgi:Flp pilus assembly protein TadD
MVGRFDQATAEIRKAQALDSLSPLINANAGWTLYLAREHEAAIDELRKAIQLKR